MADEFFLWCFCFSNYRIVFYIHSFSIPGDRDPMLSGGGTNTYLLKCGQPTMHIHSSSDTPNMGKQTYPLPPDTKQNGRQDGRPNSTDLTDRIPKQHPNIDRTLSNLVGCEKPKFTVRKPYKERDVRDKKSDSWVPSYV